MKQEIDPNEETNFLYDYRLYTSGNEAHPTYHTFCSLVALSSIISRRVWLDMSYFTIYPNLYVVLVGPPGNRKSSAMSLTKSLLRELAVIPFSGECISKEKLVEDMVEQERQIEGLDAKYKNQRIYSPMTAIVTELSEFLAISQANMIGFLTDVYDQEFYEHKTKNKGTAVVNGPFLNLLACTTPAWITTYLRSDIISGGFSRRTLFVFETEKNSRNPFPKVTPEMAQALSRVVKHANKLLNVKGPFVWSEEAREFYSDWYIKLEMPKDENLIGYYDTKHIQMLKVAMLVALSESFDLILEKRHILAALELLSLCERNLARVFQSMGKNNLNTGATQFLDLLKQFPPTTYQDQNGQTHKAIMLPLKQMEAAMFKNFNAEEFKNIIEHLKSINKISTSVIKQAGVDKVYVKLTE